MNKKRIGLIIMTIGVAAALGACKPYNKPELVEISPSQTAFQIQLEGDSSNQAQMDSEEMVRKNMVSTKRVTVEHKWIQEGRGVIFEEGRYVPTTKVIVVERKPVTREWSADPGTGTDAKNQAIVAETKESIGFSANINCVAQIDEENAAKFLYRYSGSCPEYKEGQDPSASGLTSIMDTEIRSRIQSRFAEECAKYSLEELLVKKQAIMDTIRNDVVPYFKDRGITVTTLGMSGELTYLNKGVQESIDNKFKATKEKETAAEKSETVKIQSETLDKSLKLKEIELREKELENQSEMIKKWNGAMPTYQGGQGIFQLPTPGQK